MNPAASFKASARVAEAINLAADTARGYEALYVGTTGDVVVDLPDGGVSIIFKTVAVGFFPVAVSKVYSTANGTTASNIVGLRW